jgi:hypothetical protein
VTFAKHPKTPPRAAYDRDAYRWALEQAALLRAGRFDLVDVENIAGELETLGRSELARLRSRYRIILLHHLTWDWQPERRTRSWTTSIRVQRMEAEAVMAENPGLTSHQADALAVAYGRARIEAAGETGLDEGISPETCPYDLGTFMTRDIALPQADGGAA